MNLTRRAERLQLGIALGYGQNHLVVAGACAALESDRAYGVPTRYREVVLTVSKIQK